MGNMRDEIRARQDTARALPADEKKQILDLLDAGFDQLDPAWQAISRFYTDIVDQRAGDMSLSVIVAPGISLPDGAWGYYLPEVSRIALDGAILPDAPDKLSPRISERDFLGLAALHGLFIHEAGHARHTKWPMHSDAYESPEVYQAVMLLEEIRMEARIAEERPEDAKWITACLKQTYLADGRNHVSGSSEMLRADAAKAATLIVGRVASGTISESLTWDLQIKLNQYLEHDDWSVLKDIWRRTVTIQDGDEAAMAIVAREYAKNFIPEEAELVEEPSSGSQGESDDGEDSEQQAGEQQDEDTSDGEGQGGGSDIQEAVGDALDEITESSADELNDMMDQISGGADIESMMNEDEEAGPFSSGMSTGKSVVTDRRPPTDVERFERRRLAKLFKKMRWRDRNLEIELHSAPPGRLNARQAVLRSAQRSRNQMVTATPWKRKRRRHVDMPVLAAGILIDTSGSMGVARDHIGPAMWILGNAIKDVHGNSVGVGFGDDLEVFYSPGKPPNDVITMVPDGGTERINEALEIAVKALHLLSHDGPKLMIVISDGYWAGTEGSLIPELVERDVQVIQIGIGSEPTNHGASDVVMIDEITDLTEVIAVACADALKSH